MAGAGGVNGRAGSVEALSLVRTLQNKEASMSEHSFVT